MLVAQLLVFSITLLALWWMREVQVNGLEQQDQHLRRFSEGVSAWRNSTGIPSDARQAVEILVDMPLDKRVTRGCALAMLERQQAPKNLENNLFWIARGQLDGEKKEAFDWLLLNYFLAMTYSDWLDTILIELSEAYAEIARKRIADVFRPVWIERKAKPTQTDMFDEAADARDSYDEAIRAIKERVKAGEPIPPFFLSDKPT